MSEIEERIVKVMVVPKNEPIYSEMALTVSIYDEASGEFVEVESLADNLGRISY